MAKRISDTLMNRENMEELESIFNNHEIDIKETLSFPGNIDIYIIEQHNSNIEVKKLHGKNDLQISGKKFNKILSNMDDNGIYVSSNMESYSVYYQSKTKDKNLLLLQKSSPFYVPSRFSN